ncbi:hypothetical protein J2Z50_000646 [Ensifer mexicanus]|nr:hypothetical protein [Sinorhizobium mexicanum]MBP1882381.1 hypothetical protein [Sinorhizobium mexicanum]
MPSLSDAVAGAPFADAPRRLDNTAREGLGAQDKTGAAALRQSVMPRSVSVSHEEPWPSQRLPPANVGSSMRNRFYFDPTFGRGPQSGTELYDTRAFQPNAWEHFQPRREVSRQQQPGEQTTQGGGLRESPHLGRIGGAIGGLIGATIGSHYGPQASRYGGAAGGLAGYYTGAYGGGMIEALGDYVGRNGFKGDLSGLR